MELTLQIVLSVITTVMTGFKSIGDLIEKGCSKYGIKVIFNQWIYTK